MKYAKIIDKGECMSTLYTFPQIPWPKPFLKDVANKREWEKWGVYPSNGLVAKVPYVIERDMSKNIDIEVYILRINNQFYVPMSGKGIVFISEQEYQDMQPLNKIQGMDEIQIYINDSYDILESFACKSTIEKVAIVHCVYTKTMLRNKSEVAEPFINDIFGHFVRNEVAFFLSHDVAMDFIIDCVKNSMVVEEKDDLGNMDLVTWLIGLFVQGYLRALNDHKYSLDKIFKKVFIRYYSGQ